MVLFKNYNLFSEKIIGQWIVQSTNYYTLKEGIFTDKFISQIEYTPLSNHKKCADFITNKLSIKWDHNNIKLYYVKGKSHQFTTNKYYILILTTEQQKQYLYKLDYKFNILNKFLIEFCSENFISIISSNNNIHTIKKIFFLHNNLKIVKSITKQDNKNLSISFSSEIRIS